MVYLMTFCSCELIKREKDVRKDAASERRGNDSAMMRTRITRRSNERDPRNRPQTAVLVTNAN